MLVAAGAVMLHWGYLREKGVGRVRASDSDDVCSTLAKTRTKVRNDSAVQRFPLLGSNILKLANTLHGNSCNMIEVLGHAISVTLSVMRFDPCLHMVHEI